MKLKGDSNKEGNNWKKRVINDYSNEDDEIKDAASLAMNLFHGIREKMVEYILELRDMGLLKSISDAITWFISMVCARLHLLLYK